MLRTIRTLSLLALAGVALLSAHPAQTGPGDPLLPDLIIDREILDNYRIQTVNGRKRLRFDTAITNVGAGAFEMRGERRNQREPMQGIQIIYKQGGGRRKIPLGEWEYHGVHNHWHVLNIAEYDLLDAGGNSVGEVKKVSYCLRDNKRLYPRLPRSPRSSSYRDCPTSRRATSLRTGISVGWADIYDRSVYDQWIDITDVPSGDYTLVNRANPLNTAMESRTDNNTTTVPVTIP